MVFLLSLEGELCLLNTGSRVKKLGLSEEQEEKPGKIWMLRNNIIFLFLATTLPLATHNAFSKSDAKSRERIAKQIFFDITGKKPRRSDANHINFTLEQDASLSDAVPKLAKIRIWNMEIKKIGTLAKYQAENITLCEVKADWCKLKWDALEKTTEMQLWDCGGSRDLSFVEKLKDIEVLGIRTFKGKTPHFDYSTFKCGHLKQLNILEPCLDAVDFLENAKKIDLLCIELKTPIRNADGLKFLGKAGVETLSIRTLGIKSLEFLDENMQIKKLVVPEIKDLTPITRLKKLEILVVGQLGFYQKSLRQLRRQLEKQLLKKNAQQNIQKKETEKIKSTIGLSLNDVSKALVTINTSSNAAGTGFIAKDFDGKYYLYTNQHVIRGCKTFKAKTDDGAELKTADFQISASRDIVRFQLENGAKPADALGLANSVAAEEPVGVFGNSAGGGVFTAIYGKVLGVGPDRIEVSAQFVPGNSGSPVINKKKEVVGIATYATKRTAKADWTVKGTRFCDVRRFAFKIDKNIKWIPTDWDAYQQIDAWIDDDKKSLQDVFDVAVAWVRKPYDNVSRECKEMDLKMWVVNHNKSASKMEKAKAKGQASDAKMRSLNKIAKKQIEKDYKSLSAICDRRAAAIRRKVHKYEKQLTPYLKKEIQGNAKLFEDMAKEITQYGKELAGKSAFTRK